MDISQVEIAAHSDWWSGWIGAVIGGAIGAFLGSVIPLAWASHIRRVERKGEIVGMQIELALAEVAMSALLGDGVESPLYRLPMSMFERALPKLIGERKLTTNEIGLLVEYMNRIEELNRGLERAGEASSIVGNADAVKREYGRNRLKAGNILNEKLERHEFVPLQTGAWDALIRLQFTRWFRLRRWIWRHWYYGALYQEWTTDEAAPGGQRPS